MTVFLWNWMFTKCGSCPSDCQYVSIQSSRSWSMPNPEDINTHLQNLNTVCIQNLNTLEYTRWLPGLHDDNVQMACSPTSRTAPVRSPANGSRSVLLIFDVQKKILIYFVGIIESVSRFIKENMQHLNSLYKYIFVDCLVVEWHFFHCKWVYVQKCFGKNFLWYFKNRIVVGKSPLFCYRI